MKKHGWIKGKYYSIKNILANIIYSYVIIWVILPFLTLT